MWQTSDHFNFADDAIHYDRQKNSLARSKWLCVFVYVKERLLFLFFFFFFFFYNNIFSYLSVCAGIVMVVAFPSYCDDASDDGWIGDGVVVCNCSRNNVKTGRHRKKMVACASREKASISKIGTQSLGMGASVLSLIGISLLSAVIDLSLPSEPPPIQCYQYILRI